MSESLKTTVRPDVVPLVDGKPIKVFSEKDPAKLDWSSLGAQVVVESTGLFTEGEKARAPVAFGTGVDLPGRREIKRVSRAVIVGKFMEEKWLQKAVRVDNLTRRSG